MEHFYQNLPGLFTFPEFYRFAARQQGCRHNWHGIELGCHIGQSAACLGVELINWEFDWSSTVTAKLDLCDLNHDPRPNLQPIASVLGEFHLANSVSLANRYPDDSLDLVFIDADHSYQGVKADIQAWSSKVRPGGILAGHDFCLAIPGVIQAVTECLDEFQVMRCSRWSERTRAISETEGDYYPVWWRVMP